MRKIVILTRKQLDEIESRQFDKGEEFAKEQLEAQEKLIKEKSKRIKKLLEETHELEKDYEAKITNLEIKIEVLEEAAENVRDVFKKQVELLDREGALEIVKEGLDKRTAKIKEREAQLDKEEESNFKKGYADGIADGLRKIGEITQADRDNAMKIAMVSAASHTPADNMKEINNELRITAGSESK